MTDQTETQAGCDTAAAAPAEEKKINLLGLSQQRLESLFEYMGEKKFRAKQVLQWIHQRGVTDFAQMTDISKVVRAKLAAVAEIKAPDILSQHDSADGTRKWLMSIDGGNAIETVWIPDGERATLCVSSQVGCSLDCSFCATGKQGFNRDLTCAEIIGQVWVAAKSFGQFEANSPRRVTNVVMMGMGEPLLNFHNVVDAMNLMMNDYCYAISKRRVTLSTSGVVPQLDRLADYTDVSLAISLHAPNDALRNELVPMNKKYPIAMLLDSAKRYIDRMPDNHRKMTIEYTLISEVNDRVEHAHELAELLKDIPVKINLIPFNPFEQSEYRRVSNNALRRFQQVLIERGFTATVRTTRGDDIAAACGQLAGNVNDRTKRSARHKARVGQKPLVESEPVRIISPQ